MMTREVTEIRQIHTLILGAGPAGLAAAYALAKGGRPALLVEREKVSGGLMRSLRRGEFIVDIGRKELYTRIPKVDALWKEILGSDYVSYCHREGILYEGHILESSRAWGGVLRGMPVGMLFACTVDYVLGFLKSSFFKPRNYEEYWYGRRGRKLSHVFAQGYEEKFKGVKWREMPPPVEDSDVADPLAPKHSSERKERIWRHPAKGSGQICEILEKYVRDAGGQVLFEGRLVEITASAKRIDLIKVAVGSETVSYRPEHVISSIPIELLGRFLNRSLHFPDSANQKGAATTPSGGRSTVCVYLFLDEPPRFPHVWLRVTCPGIKAGRVTNYAALSQAMVPEGKTSLCVEYFCTASDPLLSFDDEALRELALSECAGSGLIDPDACLDSFVLRLPGANAATNWRDWASEPMRALLKVLGELENLYNVNRPGTDKATYAGLEAAEAILAGDRQIFDKEMSLTLPASAYLP